MASHFDYLAQHLKSFLVKLDIQINDTQVKQIIREEGSSYYLHEEAWNKKNIKFEHGIAIVIASNFEPFKTTREQQNLDKGTFVLEYYKFFRRYLLANEADYLRENKAVSK